MLETIHDVNVAADEDASNSNLRNSSSKSSASSPHDEMPSRSSSLLRGGVVQKMARTKKGAATDLMLSLPSLSYLLKGVKSSYYRRNQSAQRWACSVAHNMNNASMSLRMLGSSSLLGVAGTGLSGK